jgi:polyribonucleotide nucleotidyltransferase
VAIGLIKEKGEAIILTDIGGVEDHYGDMDFKVAGTKDGITALQMDLKIQGIDEALMRKALEVGKVGRLFILDKMVSTIAMPKDSVSNYAPHIVSFKINQSKIGEVIGPGGKNIKKIIQDTGVTIDISDDGTVQIASHDSAAIEMAVNIVKGITEEPEVGKIYKGKVKRILNFGAFCEILPGKEGLVHVSELANRFVKNVEDVVKLGDEVTVKVIGIDEQGRVNLSKKQADPDWVPARDKEEGDAPHKRT